MSSSAKALLNLKSSHSDRVEDAYFNAADEDDTGAWIILKPGWTADPRDAHDIHEMTIPEAIARFRQVQRCRCDNCKGLA